MHEQKIIYYVCCLRITQLMFRCRVKLYTRMFTAPLHHFVASTYSIQSYETHQRTHVQVQQHKILHLQYLCCSTCKWVCNNTKPYTLLFNMDLDKKKVYSSRHLSKVFSSCLQTISSAVMGSPVLLLATTMLPSLQNNKTLSKSAVCNGSKIAPPPYNK